MPLLGIEGLSDYNVPHRAAFTGSGPGQTFIGSDFRNAYVPGPAVPTGAGQTVGLLEIEGGFYASDIAAYENLAKISTNVVLETFPIDGYDEGPGSQLANEEVSADIEMAIAMAPGLQRVIVYEGVTYYGIDVLNTMATDNRATAAPLTRT